MTTTFVRARAARAAALTIAAVTILTAASAHAQWTDILDEPFNYAGDAGLWAAWNAGGAPPDYHLDTVFGNPLPSLAMPSPGANHTVRLARNLGSDYNPTAGHTLALEFDFYLDPVDAGTWWSGARHYVDLRGYAGNAFGVGGLENLVAMGIYTSSDAPNDPFSTEYYQARILGLGWVTLDNRLSAGDPIDPSVPKRSVGWHGMQVLITDTQVAFYIDGLHCETRPRPNSQGFDCAVLGSGLTANGRDAWVDNVNCRYFTPQPGACCYYDAVCTMSTILAPGDCAIGGTYLGDNTTCSSNVCSPVTDLGCANWSSSSPPNVSGPTAYDSARGVTVMFAVPFTWEWDGTTWELRNSATSPQGGGAMAYDSIRGVTVMFGGDLGNETWEWDGTNWTQRFPEYNPQWRGSAAMAYDSARGKTVLFGGSYYAGGSTSTYLDDTWEWDGTNWTPVNPPNRPPARSNHAMTYDSARGKVVMFGGYIDLGSGSVNYGDTWEWNGAGWTQRSPATSPSAREQHQMAYDTARGVTVLFGGSCALCFPLRDTWEWNGTNWTQRSPVTYPASGGYMAYDSARSVTVLHGGSWASADLLEHTWEWNGTDWMLRDPAARPAGREFQAIAYDSARDVTVMFGGWRGASYFNDTWEWDGMTWTQRSPVTSPFERRYHAMAYDSARGVTVMFGSVPNDTWEWNGANWAQRFPATSPSVRHYPAMAYDTVRGVTVLFGGENSSISYFNETWEWDGTNWTLRSPATSPAARRAPAMAYDSARGVTVMFGGSDINDVILGDTWEWNGTSWTQRSPVTSPAPRRYHAMAYDSVRDVTILFGGNNPSLSDYMGDTWEWDGTNWTVRNWASSPQRRLGHSMTYDSVRREAVLFGGFRGGEYYGDIWELGILAPDADLNVSGLSNGRDIRTFVAALLSASTSPSDLCHGDFNSNGVIDPGDVSGFVQKVLGL